jgi:hypothetical protein
MHAIVTATVGLLLAGAASAAAQTWQPPPDSQRCPSKWGATDQRGSGNHMTPEAVLRAARLIRTGEVFELGRVLSDSMPLPAGRRFELVTKRTRNDPGTNRRGSNEELVVVEIGQVGTQFDGPGHIGKRMALADGTTADVYCNGVQGAEMRHPYGLAKLGIEHVRPFVTRGILDSLARPTRSARRPASGPRRSKGVLW